MINLLFATEFSNNRTIAVLMIAILRSRLCTYNDEGREGRKEGRKMESKWKIKTRNGEHPEGSWRQVFKANSFYAMHAQCHSFTEAITVTTQRGTTILSASL